MKRFIRVLSAFMLLWLAACNLPKTPSENGMAQTPPGTRTAVTAAPSPTMLPAAVTAPPAPTQQTAAETARPTLTKPSASATPPALPPVPIVYYYFVAIEGKTFPAGSVVILPEVLILGPTFSDKARSPDVVTNIRSALQAMIRDPRNAWKSEALSIAGITFKEGTADVTLQGKILGAGDVVLIAARMQILMTVFAEDAVKTARITLNGESIANLGISHSSEAKPAGYTYTRAEIEAFMKENAYN